jgi:hypothetical protein
MKTDLSQKTIMNTSPVHGDTPRTLTYKKLAAIYSHAHALIVVAAIISLNNQHQLEK